jgi:hypothetical protein
VNNTIVNGSLGIDIISNSNLIFGNHIKNYNLSINVGGNRNIVCFNNLENNRCGVALHGSNNTFSKNNFINNIRNVRAYSSNGTWDSNYWNRPRTLPKTIWGRRFVWIIRPKGRHGLGWGVYVPWPMFDLNPASEPYDIP